MASRTIQRLGQGLQITSQSRLRKVTDSIVELIRLTPQAPTTALLGSIDASQVVSGTFANARVAAGNVTQHQAALAIAMSQLTGTLAANQGGSGFSAYTAGDLLYANTISTLAKLGIGSAGDLLRVSGGAPAWQAVSTLAIAWAQLTGVPSTFTPADHLVTGTWTPADNSGAGLSISVADARYVKHESLVIARARILYPTTADVSSAKLSGLPFAVDANESSRQGFVSYSDAALVLNILPAGSTSTAQFFTTGGGGVTNAQLSDKLIFFTLIYST